MGSLSLARAYRNGASTPPMLGGGTKPAVFGGGASGFTPKSPIESLGTSSATKGAADVFAAAGRLPGQVYATPFAAADVATGGLVGRVGSFVGGIPGVGATVGGLDTAIKKEGAIVPAFLNRQDAAIWSVVGHLPDNTEITNDLLAKGGILQTSLLGGQQQTGGIPVIGNIMQALGLGLGPGSHNKTVKELRDELTNRGFFYDSKGTQLDPKQLANDIATGKRSVWDFGTQAINDDPLVSVAGSLALDPMNLLFLVPGANVARAAALAAKLGEAGRGLNMIQKFSEGMKLVKIADAVTGAPKTVNTLSKLAGVLKTYQKVAIGTAATNTVLNIGSRVINTYDLPGESPFTHSVQDFTDQVTGRRDAMSENSALTLFAAFTFPYGGIARGTIGRAGKAAERAFGPGLLDDFAIEADKAPPIPGSTLRGTKKLVQMAGGPESLVRMVNFAKMLIAARSEHVTPAVRVMIDTMRKSGSLPELVESVRFSKIALGKVIATMDRNHEFTGKALLTEMQDLFEKQGGFVKDKAWSKEKETVGINAPDFTTMMKRWGDFYHTQGEMLGNLMDVSGELTLGLREKIIKEHIDSVHQTLQDARQYMIVDGKRTEVVPLNVIRQVLNDNPHLQFDDKTGYWSQFGEGADPKHPPTWASLRAKLASARRNAPSMSEYYAPIADLERKAPKDIQAEFVAYRGQRDLRAEIDDLRAAMESEQAAPATGKTAADVQAVVDKLQRLADDPSATPGEAAAARSAIDRVTSATDSDLGRRLREVSDLLKAEQLKHEQAVAAGAPGLDPAYMQKVYETAAANADVPLPFFDAAIKHADPVEKILLGILDREMAHATPSYQVTGLPRKLVEAVPDSVMSPVRYRNSLGEALFVQGALSGVGRALHTMTRPISNSELHRGMRQQLQSQLLRMGWKVGEIDTLIHNLEETAALPKQAVGTVNVALHREAIALWPSQVDEAFLKMVKTFKGPARTKALRMLDEAGGGYQVLGAAHSRFSGGLHAKVQPGREAEVLMQEAEGRAVLDQDRAVRARAAIEGVTTKRAKANRAAKADAADAKAAESRAAADAAKAYHAKVRNPSAERMMALYNGWMTNDHFKGLSRGQRMLAKFFYPIFRFTADPRYTLMNYMEGPILSSTRFGRLRGYKNEAQASQAAQFFEGESRSRFDMTTDLAQQPNLRPMNLLAQAAFDHAKTQRIADRITELEQLGHRAEAAKLRTEQGLAMTQEMEALLDEHGNTNASLRTLRQGMADEVVDLRSKADAGLADGSLTDAQAAEMHTVADHYAKASNRSLADYLSEQMYRMEQVGPDVAVTEQIQKAVTRENFAQMAPLLQELHDVNVRTWTDVRKLFYGNPSRSNLERLMNSYWLYWPLSYQVKATKWLAQIMLDGSFGNDNHALLAGRYAIWQQQHNEMLVNNPDYRAMMEANPVVGFVAQMLMPISPDGIGVSLSRMTRVIGTFGEDEFNSVFGPKRLGPDGKPQNVGLGWTDGQLNAFTLDALLKHPGDVPQYVATFGPIYTLDLISRLGRDVEGAATTVPTQTFTPAPTSATLGGVQMLPPIRQP